MLPIQPPPQGTPMPSDSGAAMPSCAGERTTRVQSLDGANPERGTTMSAVTTTKAVPTKAESYLSALRKCKDPKASESIALLTSVAEFVASDAAVKTAKADVDDLTGRLTTARGTYDGLITFRTRAIVTALEVGFSVRTIARTYSVSTGQVGNLSAARQTRLALKQGGNANPPSVESLVTAVTNLPKGTKASDVIAHAAKTGEVLRATTTTEAPKAPPTTKATLTRAQGVADAVKAMTIGADDIATVGEIRKALTKALANLEARAPKQAPKPTPPTSRVVATSSTPVTTAA